VFDSDHDALARPKADNDKFLATKADEAAQIKVLTQRVDALESAPLGFVTVTHAPAEIEARMRALGAAGGPPWRKEQKLACLSVRPLAGGDLPR
jgi:hypothetical protein